MNQPAWLFDEFSSGGEEFLDPQFVETYERKAGHGPEEDIAHLRELGLSKDHVLEFGPGTGLLALEAARRGTANIECVNKGFLTYEHGGEQVDFINTRNALRQPPDFWKAGGLYRMAERLKPGGILVLRDLIFSFDQRDADRVIANWVEAAPLDPRDGWTRAELEAHLRHEHRTFCWLLEPILERAGFEIRETWFSDSGIFAGDSGARRLTP